MEAMFSSACGSPCLWNLLPNPSSMGQEQVQSPDIMLL
jgi:hypothetical protein